MFRGKSFLNLPLEVKAARLIIMPKITALGFIDSALLPIVFVVSAKFAVVFLLTIFFGLSWSFTNNSPNHLLFFSFPKFSDVVFASTISDIVVVGVCCVGLGWNVFQGSHFRKDKIHPNEEAYLHQTSKELLIVSREKSFRQTSVWLVISWIVLYSVLINTLAAITSFFVLGFGLGIVLALTLAFYKELVKS